MKSFLNIFINKLTLLLFFLLCSAFFASAQNQDSKGTDFWLTFPGNYDNGSTATLFISADNNTSGTVSIPSVGFTQDFTVTVGNITSVVLPSSVFLTTSSTILNNGIHVTSKNEVTIYGLNREQYTTDAYLGLPTDILGTSYINLGYTSNGEGTQFGIVATQNGTTVTITPTTTVDSHTAGTAYTITLDQGQTYFLRDQTYGNDLSGSIITSDKAIGVFGGHQCANVPLNAYACDYLVEELPPTTEWGKNFVTVPLKTRLNGDTFRFLASENNTDVSVNGSVVATLNKGQFYETILDGPKQVTSTKPILVAQYSNGSSYDGVTSDPFMMLIPPYEQFLNNYTITTPATGFSGNFVNVVAPSAAVGHITLDGTTIPSSDFTAIGSSGFSGAQEDISLGVHTLNSTLPFGVFVYGYADYDSYGYPGGQSLSEVATVTTLSLTPKTGSASVNSSQCFTGLLQDQHNNPVSSVRVDFKIQGANDTTGFGNTDANGKATFCYYGPMAGIDTIIATVGTLSDTSYFTRTSSDTSSNAPPYYNYAITPVDGTDFSIHTGETVSFDVQALDSTVGDKVTLTATGIPSGATVTPSLPAMGNPVTVHVSWTAGAGDIGTHPIMFTATDTSGNTAVTNIVVSVSNLCHCDSTFKSSICVTPRATVKGQAYHTIYKGYGLQRVLLTAMPHGGVAPYTYMWSNGSTSAMRIVAPDTTTQYTVTITDSRGCTSTVRVIIYVIDVRCTTPGNIYICYKGETMSVPKAEVSEWLGKGAKLGSCSILLTSAVNEVPDNTARTNSDLKALTAQSSDAAFSVYPNPAKSVIYFKWNVSGVSNAKIIITDLQGRILISQSLTSNLQNINISQLVNGVYMAKLVTADKVIATNRFMVNK